MAVISSVRFNHRHLSFSTRDAPTSLGTRQPARALGRTASIHRIHAEHPAHGFGHRRHGGGDEDQAVPLFTVPLQSLPGLSGNVGFQMVFSEVVRIRRQNIPGRKGEVAAIARRIVNSPPA